MSLPALQDGELLGNTNGSDHNCDFTVETHQTFTYEEGQTITVSGNDDIWVFINGQLALDLGGIHGEESKTVELGTIRSVSSGQVTVCTC